MNLGRLRLAALPIASLLLILLLCAFAIRRPEPCVGLRIHIPKLRQHSVGYLCEDDIPQVVRLAADRKTWFVYTEINPDKLVKPWKQQVREGTRGLSM